MKCYRNLIKDAKLAATNVKLLWMLLNTICTYSTTNSCNGVMTC